MMIIIMLIFNGCEWLVESLDAIHTIGNIVFALIKDKYKVCSEAVMLSHAAINSQPSKQQIANLIHYGVQVVSHTLNTQPTLPINYHCITSYVTSHTIKLLKVLCFSRVLLHTHLTIVLHPNYLNINFIPITIPSTFYHSCMIWNANSNA